MAAVVGDDGGSSDVATSLDDARMFRPPKLNLAERRMFHVPPEIASMHFLEELSLAGNRISALPAGCLPPSLHALTLTGNILDTLPHHIMALPLLQRLNCGANRLSSCEIIFQCSALLHAGLSFNHISSFVVPDGRAPPLISLDLSNNKLENLAQTLYELRKLPHLASLSLLGNPFCMRKGFHDKVLRQLPKLVFFNGKKRVVKDAEGEGAEGADHFPMPEDSEAGTNGQTPKPEDVAAKGSAEDPPSLQLVSLRLEMRSLTIRDPRQPVAPEWTAAVADASATKAKKGKTEDSVPLIPPVRYSVEWEMADGRAVSTFCKKVEIDPRKLAELAAAAEGGGKAGGRVTGSRGGSRDGRKKTPEVGRRGSVPLVQTSLRLRRELTILLCFADADN